MRYKMSKLKEMTKDIFKIIINAIGKKNNKTSVSAADQEIPTLRSRDIAGKSANLISGIIRLPSNWDFLVCIGH